MPDSSAIPLSSAYTFTLEKATAVKLPPKGLFRFLRGEFGKAPKGDFNHTLFFSSFIQQSFYREQILRHAMFPHAEQHGPFLISELSPADFEAQAWSDCLANINRHLSFSRYGSEPLDKESHEKLFAFVRACNNNHGAGIFSYHLTPCVAFSAIENRHYAHEWSHSLLEFHEYVLLDTLVNQFSCMIFAFD